MLHTHVPHAVKHQHCRTPPWQVIVGVENDFNILIGEDASEASDGVYIGGCQHHHSQLEGQLPLLDAIPTVAAKVLHGVLLAVFCVLPS